MAVPGTGRGAASNGPVAVEHKRAAPLPSGGERCTAGARGPRPRVARPAGRLRGVAAACRAAAGLGATALAWAGAPVPAGAQDPGDLLELSIEELGQVQVTSVSRREESLNDAAAAVYVITGEEIRRSGVTSIPDALRLAPGVQVARNSSHSWTISMRGFSSDLSNKLLVMIDGRSVYSPLFAGVFWDAQDVLLEDIDRIEVIAGPAGTIWGANAVNGVINIITRSAWDTDGGLLLAGAGDEQELLAGLRYAGRIGEDIAARAYVKHSERDATRTPAGEEGSDDWDIAQAGFRLDWEVGEEDALTLQGDVYGADESALLRGEFTLGTLPEENVPGTIDIAGHNVLARWGRTLDRGGNFQLQLYYDRTERDIPGTYDESRDTFDVDFQHRIGLYGRHDLIWGAGLRTSSDTIANTTFATFDPASRKDRTYSLFVQDEINLNDRKVFLTLGSKIERNDYSGFEHQPSVRLTWLVTERQTFWAAASRAVRIPARLNEDLELYAPIPLPGFDLPVYANVEGTDAFSPEELLAREAGYRVRLRDDLSIDLVLYHHEYDKLLTNEVLGPLQTIAGPPDYVVIPIALGNGLRGDTYGGTVAADWEALERWRLRFQYSRIDFDLDLRAGSADTNALNVAGNSPEQQTAAYSFLELPRNVTLFTGIRYVADLPNQNVPSYVSVDANVLWRVNARLAASLGLHNLNDEQHAEFGEGHEIERSAFAKVDWTF